MDPFEKLPDKLVCAIFQHVPREELLKCRKVCLRWSKLVHDLSLLVREITIPANKWKITFDFFAGMVLKREINEIRIFGKIHPPIGSFPPDYKLSLRVLHLDFQQARIGEPHYLALKEVWSRTTSELVELHLWDAVCWEDSFIDFIGGNPNLEVLDLSLCQMIPTSLFPKVLQRCKGLKEIILDDASLDEFDLALTAEVGLVENLHTNIVRLSLKSALGYWLCHEDLPEIFKKCPNLKSLDITHVEGISRVAIYMAAKQNPQVELIPSCDDIFDSNDDLYFSDSDDNDDEISRLLTRALIKGTITTNVPDDDIFFI